jgi:tripartite-type tricarboxylate transporter receptor subunit TctC
MIEEKKGCTFVLVPFPSDGEAMAAALGGHIDVASSGPEIFAHDVEKWNLLATSSPERVSDLPGVPTYVELGVPAMTNVRVGGFVREETPEAFVDWIEQAAENAFNDEGFQDWAERTDFTVGVFMDREAWAKYLSEWFVEQEAIIPALKKDMEELAK